MQCLGPEGSVLVSVDDALPGRALVHGCDPLGLCDRVLCGIHGALHCSPHQRRNQMSVRRATSGWEPWWDTVVAYRVWWLVP
jgi:hypothetical protein